MKKPNELKKILGDAKTQLSSPSTIPAVNKVNNQLSENIRSFLAGIDDATNKGELLWLGVVGQMKAGKSSFLNSLLFDGETILPVAATPMTAGLTTIRNTDGNNTLEICYYSDEDWDSIKKEAEAYDELLRELLRSKPALRGNNKMIEIELGKIATPSQQSSAQLVEMIAQHPEAREKIGSEPVRIEFDNITDLKDRMKDLVGANGRFTSVVSILHIYIKDDRLKDFCIIDTPGVNDPVVSREVLTHQFLHKCHGVFMLSKASRFMDDHDKIFMDQRLASVGVDTILMIGSQFDNALIAPQYEGWSLTRAINKATEDLKGHFDSRRGYLRSKTSNSICGFILSSGMANAVLTKLKKNNFDISSSNMDTDELKFFDNLKEQYPNDFSDNESIEKSLNMLANFKPIREVITNNFKKRKTEIRKSKYRSFFEEQTRILNEALVKASERITDELELIEHNSLDDLRNQIMILEDSLDSVERPLQITIDAYAETLQSGWDGIEQKELSKDGIRVECNYVPTLKTKIDYTRKGTMFGFSKSGSIEVHLLDRETIKDKQKSAIDKYRDTVAEKWQTLFPEFVSDMLEKLVAKIQAINPVLAACTQSITNITRETFEVRMEPYKVLKLEEIRKEAVDEIIDYINESARTSIKKNFEVASKEDVEKSISKEASDKNEGTRKGIHQRDKNYMQSINEVPRTHVLKVVALLNDLRNNIKGILRETATQILEEKQQLYDDRQQTLDKLNEAIERFDKIKSELNE